MDKTYARQLIDEFEEMRQEYDYTKFISTLKPKKGTVHHFEKFIKILESDLSKLLEKDGKYKKEVDDINLGNERDYEVTLFLLKRFKEHLSQNYNLETISSL